MIRKRKTDRSPLLGRGHRARPETPASPAVSREKGRDRQRKELLWIGIIILVVVALTFTENRIIHFGDEFPISNTILMFVLININLLLLMLLIFLVLRNLVKLLYERKHRVMGARLRTRLVVAFIGLTLLPTTVLFFLSLNFISGSIEFWFNVPVEKALDNALGVARAFYDQAEAQNRFFARRIAYEIRNKGYLAPAQQKALSHYLEVVQNAFHLDAVEVYDSRGERLAVAVSGEAELEPLAPAEVVKPAEEGRVRSVSNKMNGGEAFRTLGTIPFESRPPPVQGFVAVAALLSPETAQHMHAVSRGFEEYHQTKLLKEPIQLSYFITISVVSLLVLFCAIWFGFYLAKSITTPIKELAEGTRRVAEGNLNFSIARTADDEIGSLVESFNRMTRDLRVSREQLELSAGKLRAQNVEIEERRRYMEIVLKNVSAGVITLDSRGRVTTINTSAERMLAIDGAAIIGSRYENLLDAQHRQLAEEVSQNLFSSGNDALQVPLRMTVAGQPRSFLIHVNLLRDETGKNMGVVMVFDDLTDQEKAQRMAAWREVARRIAHEVKNPLTPITLSAQRLKRKYSERIADPVFAECTAMIIEQVELIRNLVNEFARFARFPAANPVYQAIGPILTETLALYKEGHPGVRFLADIPADLPGLNLDRQQIKQALINLVDNAIAAMKGEGEIRLGLSQDRSRNTVRLEVADTGPGILEADKSRLFEPYFSTKKSGMGLGLTIVNSIVADHQATIRVTDNPPQGTCFVIEFPAA